MAALNTTIAQILTWMQNHPETTFIAGLAIAFSFSRDRVRRRIPIFPWLYWTGGLVIVSSLFYITTVVSPDGSTQVILFKLAEGLFFGATLAVVTQILDIGPNLM